MSFHNFQQRLGKQLMEYNSANNYYDGNNKLRQFTQLNSKQRASGVKNKRSMKRKTTMILDSDSNDKMCSLCIEDIVKGFCSG